MRRQLLDELPLLMRIYPGMKPWDLDDFTLAELDRLLRHAKQVLDTTGA